MWATEIDKLPADARVLPRDGYLVVRSPGNPEHWWGNVLVFDDAPAEGDRVRWERLFEAEFADEPQIRHRTFAWDRTDGEMGPAPGTWRWTAPISWSAAAADYHALGLYESLGFRRAEHVHGVCSTPAAARASSGSG